MVATPTRPSPPAGIAFALQQTGRPAESAAIYRALLASYPRWVNAHYNLGLLYLDTEPYPGISDDLVRLNAAKGFFEQYKNMPGVDIKLYDSRMKDVDKMIKRVQKQQKKKKTG